MFSFLRRKKKTETEESKDVSHEVTSDVNNLDQQDVVEQTPSKSTDTSPLIDASPPAQNKITTESLSESIDSKPEIVEIGINQAAEAPAVETIVAEVAIEEAVKEVIEEKPKKESFFTRLKKGLSKTRQGFTDSLASLVLGRKEIDDDLLEELEMILLTADVGIDATDRIISNLTEQVSRKELKDPEALVTSLKGQLEAILEPMISPLEVDDHLVNNEGPFVILMVGINGVGKTTTIGKLAHKYKQEGKSVMLAAGDTFRAAAVEQLQTWGERNDVPVIAQKTGADSAAVLFDAIQSAKAKKIDILIADTAGRLHTQTNLMEELKKVGRVMAKIDPTAPHEVMLVIDAGTGQNALNQAQQFKEAIGVSGITLTKLDGTAKGGIVFALAEQTQIPIRFIGVGESIDDLRPFESKAFTKALFDQESH
ncbi:MAG: fused signal recognition particle receptor [Thiomicrorhabdus sp.]|nr:MAG: fused signal recognition particle receptor [Thiomicrorhabdus sp.]